VKLNIVATSADVWAAVGPIAAGQPPPNRRAAVPGRLSAPVAMCAEQFSSSALSKLYEAFIVAVLLRSGAQVPRSGAGPARARRGPAFFFPGPPGQDPGGPAPDRSRTPPPDAGRRTPAPDHAGPRRTPDAGPPPDRRRTPTDRGGGLPDRTLRRGPFSRKAHRAARHRAPDRAPRTKLHQWTEIAIS